ncbi:MAG TPA: alternative ribosome rescue aminoacyl-tRNA hydrolase ArfB [Gemmataceae bacterium]|nr:alternative ribosome rescue aminoacyl-tRNA hydrolase ArfB [Gemmataceae bacterium]
MLEFGRGIRIPETEFHWTYVRSGGPGGQNVNKVASKAVLRWDVAGSPSLPPEVKQRLQAQQRGRITVGGELILSSQRYRDQERNRQDCLEKLGEMIGKAALRPKVRRVSKATRASREARLRDKRRRGAAKSARRKPVEE